MTFRLTTFLISITIGVSSYASGQGVTMGDVTSHSARQHFELGSALLTPGDTLKSFIIQADSLNMTGSLASINIEGTASPEGPENLNTRLSYQRATAVKKYIIENSTIPSSIITATGTGENWKDIERHITGRKDMPVDEIIYIVNSCTDRRLAEQRLRALDCWPTLLNVIFPKLRHSTITLQLTDNTTIELIVENESSDNESSETIPVQESIIPDSLPEPVHEPITKPFDCLKSWHIETNAIEWGLLIANIGAERDLSCHWSAVLSLHYSAFNYMTSTRKFRAFIIRPEARYWLTEGHHGMFIEGHLQMASYNFALSGWKYRIQDVDGKTPALGGGLGIGYRLPVGTSGHWALQAQAGVGVYRLKYNRFENHINGPLVDTRSRTWCGIDNVAISVVYNFNTQK